MSRSTLVPKIKVKGHTVQTGECPQTNVWTDATKRIIAPAMWSIITISPNLGYQDKTLVHINETMLIE